MKSRLVDAGVPGSSIWQVCQIEDEIQVGRCRWPSQTIWPGVIRWYFTRFHYTSREKYYTSSGRNDWLVQRKLLSFDPSSNCTCGTALPVPLLSARNPRTPVMITTHVLTFCAGFLCLLTALLWRRTHLRSYPMSWGAAKSEKFMTYQATL